MFWTYSRLARLDALMARCREAQAYLQYARCDATDGGERADIDRRLAAVNARFHHISAAARSERRRVNLALSEPSRN